MKHLKQAIFAKFQEICEGRDPSRFHLKFNNDVRVTITEIDDQCVSFRIEFPEVTYNCYLNKFACLGLSFTDYENDESGEKHATDTLALPRILRVLAEAFELSDQYYNKVTVKPLPPLPPNSNPYHYEQTLCGATIHGATHAMFSATGNEAKTVVLINTRTGKRVEVDLSALND